MSGALVAVATRYMAASSVRIVLSEGGEMANVQGPLHGSRVFPRSPAKASGPPVARNLCRNQRSAARLTGHRWRSTVAANVGFGPGGGQYENALPSESVDQFRKAADNPDARFPTLTVKHDSVSFHQVYDWAGSVNQGQLGGVLHPAYSWIIMHRLRRDYGRD